RATASHDVQLDGVFIKDAQVGARRPWGKLDPFLLHALVHFSPLVSAVYYGIAAAARDEVLRVVTSRRGGNGELLANDPGVQRNVGLIDAKLRTAWWAVLGALNDMGEDYTIDEETVSRLQIAKRSVVTNAIEIVDLAMGAVGGASYFKRSVLERAYRDVRA